MGHYTVGAIFARGGSKGLPRKALCKVGNRTLLEIAIDHASQCEGIDSVVVSTDDPDYAEQAESAGAEVPFIRPPELATDESPEIDSWRHLIRHLDKTSGRPDVLVSVPVTAPLRTVEDIDSALNLFHSVPTDLVVTAYRSTINPFFNMMTIDNEGQAGLAARTERKVFRRQDAPEVWALTTVAFVANPNFVMSTHHLFDGRVSICQVPEDRAVDIDTPRDLDWANYLLSEPA